VSALLLALLLGAPAAAGVAEEAAVQDDLALVLKTAGLAPDAVSFARAPARGAEASVQVACAGPYVRVIVSAPDEEWGPAFYHGLHQLGFLWPHPRRQVSPSAKSLRAACGKTFAWRPRLKVRGFHLHTQHPSEWAAGFLEGRGTIAEETVRWLARNRQNVLQVKALRTEDPARLAAPFLLARSLGLRTGLDVSLCSVQQKGYRLLGAVPALLGAVLPHAAAGRVARRVKRLMDAVPFDYLSLELGTSEFTRSPKSATLAWLEAARAAMEPRGPVFTKVHVSSGQGRYNFLAAEADPRVGVEVHTVMPFSLDGPAPVYGRNDFSDLKAFLLEQRGKRPVWYFPETSYFIGIDIDVPLLLTDYLLSRSADMDLLEREGIEGQVDFSTGQELGYWLMDWTVALLADGDARGGPLAGLRLLGEDEALWKTHLDYQHHWFVEEGALSMLSAANLMDEMPFLKDRHRALRRRVMKELERDPVALAAETATLEGAAAAIPSTAGVKDDELRALLDVTYGRVRHALAVRRALAHPRGSPERAAELALARGERLAALERMKVVVKAGRYPEARLFERRPDPGSYDYGYGWPAATLLFWEREERIVAEGRVSPFFDTPYRALAILF
jgi:hypothetical protein